MGTKRTVAGDESNGRRDCSRDAGKTGLLRQDHARVRPNGESLIALSQAGQIRDRRTGMDTHCSHISALGRGTVQSGMCWHCDWHGRVWHEQDRSYVFGPSSWRGSSSNTLLCESRAPSPSISGRSEPYRYQRVRVGSTAGRREAYGVAVRVLSPPSVHERALHVAAIASPPPTLPRAPARMSCRRR